MTVFDDFEPEDAWSPEDPISLQVRNLLQRLALLIVADGIDFKGDLDLIDDVLKRVRGQRPLERDVLRADDLVTDLAFVRSRL